MKRQSRRVSHGRRLMAAIAGIAVALSGTMALETTLAPGAAANVALQFDAGNIISDALFYDGAAMTENEVQVFLDQKVQNCLIGSTYAPGSSYGSNVIGQSCLKNFRMNTASRSANAYCTGYEGRPNESAAQIVARVGIACGISQKVLLVMLEKEQSLVSDSWPFQRQLDVAMGYACPDSGPNNSPECDPTQTGFYQQVYRAAWQLKVYKARPNEYRYRPFQTNTIQWHPNSGCGASQVYISNWATAALYIYTPYRPNQAALRAGWGQGDGCSSYGNRNFFNFYTSWFGSTQRVGEALIDALHADLGGSTGFLGASTSEHLAIVNSNGSGLARAYVGGSIYWTPSLGARYVYGSILARYFASNGADGELGWPESNPSLIASGPGGVGQSFQGGSVFYENGGAPRVVRGDIRSEYFRLGGAAGVLGWPEDEIQQIGNGTGQSFRGGSVFREDGKPAFSVRGTLRDAYFAAGSALGFLGWPTSAQIEIPQNGGGKAQAFDGGSIYSSAAGSYAVSGAIREAYFARSGAIGSLGWPVSAVQCEAESGLCAQGFQGGDLIWTVEGGARVGSLSIERLRDQLRNSDQDLGEPLSGLLIIAQNGGGQAQVFERASVYSSSRGAFSVSGAIREAYFSRNGAAGPLGWPISARTLVSSTYSQEFVGGTIIGSVSRAVVIQPKVAQAYVEAGGAAVLGAPLTGELQIGSPKPGVGQVFEGGSIFWSNSTLPVAVTGGIRDAYFARGGATGLLGYPTEPVSCDAMATACQQRFQGGVLEWSQALGARVR